MICNNDPNIIVKVHGGAVMKNIPLGMELTINTITYQTFWPIKPTKTNRVYGFSFDPSDGHVVRIFNNRGVYSVQEYMPLVYDVEIDSVFYKAFWPVKPTNDNQVYGFGFNPYDGHAIRIFNDHGTYSIQEYVLNG